MSAKRLSQISDPSHPGYIQESLFEAPKTSYNAYPRLVSKVEDVREIMRRGAEEGKIGCDLEFNANRPTIFGAACKDTAGAVRWDESLAAECLELAEKSGAVIVGHSTIGAEKQQFEKELGVKTPVSIWGCSMIGHHLVNGHLTKMAGKAEEEDAGSLGLMGLSTVTSLETDLPAYKYCRGNFCEGPCPRHQVWSYCSIDAWGSLIASYNQEAEMASLGIPHQFYRDCLELTDICMEMEKTGLRIDREWVKHMDKAGTEFKNTLFPYDLINKKPVYKEFNPKAAPQITEYFAGHGITLKDSTKGEVAKVLEKVARKEGINGETIKELCSELELAPELSPGLDCLYRLYQFKDAGKGVKSWFDDKYYGKDGRIHPRFITTGTCTGRLSSSRPNFQNLGARGWAKELKKAIIPDDGYDFVESDWSQLELRIILYLAGFDVKQIPLDAFKWLVSQAPGAFDKAASLMAMSSRDVAKSISHGCLTADHDVLTPAGWIPIDFWKGEDIATWSTTGEITFTQPLRYIETETNETIELFGTAISQKVTPDHKFPILISGTSEGKLYEKWHDTQARNLSKNRLPLCGKHEGPNVYHTNDLRRAIAIQADGSACAGWPGHWKFHLKKERKIKRVEELFNIKMKQTPSGTWSGVVKFSSNLLSEDKKLTWNFLRTTAEQKASCVEESTFWDGSLGKGNSRHYRGADEQSMCVLQTLAALSNQQGLWRVGGPGGYPGSTKIVNTLSYNNRKYADIQRLTKLSHTSQEKTKVYCFTTSTGYFMIRRNNTISVTGNSDYLEGIQIKTGQELETERMQKEIREGARVVYTKKNYPQLTRDWTFRGGYVTFTGANLAERIFGSKTLENRRKAHEIVEDIYFKQFFAIREWQMRVLEQAESGLVKSPAGRVLKLYGSPEDDAKMAVAFFGQGVGADHARSVILWRKRNEGLIPVLTVHDSVLQQFPSHWSDKQALEMVKSMQEETPLLPGFVNPGKAKRGKNYGDLFPI